MKTYFGFAIADGMFGANTTCTKQEIDINTVKAMIPTAIPCLNPSHKATIDVMRSQFGIEIAIPEKPPRVSLVNGDRVIVMSVRGLPRLQDRHEYTPEEIASATFAFSLWTVLPTIADIVQEIERTDLPAAIVEHYATLKGPRTRGSTSEIGLNGLPLARRLEVLNVDSAIATPGCTYYTCVAPELKGRIGALSRHEIEGRGFEIAKRDGAHGPELYCPNYNSNTVSTMLLTVIVGPDNLVWTWHPGAPLGSIRHLPEDHPMVAVKLS